MSLTRRLEDIVGPRGLGEVDALPGVPVAAPADAAQAATLFALARAERLPLALCGNGSALGEALLAREPAFLLSSRRLEGLVEFEPGDGTLTARAGTTLGALRAATAARGLEVTPDVARPERATLGGVIGAGRSGPDRHALGPARLHVLGVRALQLDGATTRSGGNLVKNVSGYDLHRLLTGSFGSLALVLEASLRLASAPERLLLCSRACDDLSGGLDAAAAVRSAPIAPRALTLEGAGPTYRLHVALAGRAEHLALERARLGEVLGDLEALEDAAARERAEALRDLEPDGRDRPALRLACAPSRLRACLGELFDVLGPEHAARLLVQPGVAAVDLAIDRPGAARLVELLPPLRARLAPLGGRAALRVARPQPLAHAEDGVDSARLALQERLRATYDPERLLCTRPPLGGLR